MCASACFFVFVAGVKRTGDYDFQDANLGIHSPYLSDDDLRSLNGDQAIASANRIRAVVENYLKEMSVATKYADLMFSVPKDQVRWIKKADFEADLEGIIPELRNWLAARCDKRTDIEKAVWEKLKVDPRPLGQLPPAERSISEMLLKKMSQVHDCEFNTLNELSGNAWLQIFDPTCAAIEPGARSLAGARSFCQLGLPKCAYTLAARLFMVIINS